MSKSKSRSLKPYQYYQILQIEFIVAQLRVRLYPNQKDKDYWEKVSEGKKKTVEQIAEKNRLPTIFTDEEMRRIFELKVYREKGIADFTYRDEAHREAQEPLDYIYYFSKGSDVRFDWFGEQKIGTIKSYVPGEKVVLVTDSEGKTVDLPLEEVTRIL
jgi:hypothetical protein